MPLLATVAVACLSRGALAQDPGLYLFQMKAELAAPARQVASSRAAIVTVTTDRVEQLQAQLQQTNARVLGTGASTITVRLPRNTVFDAPPAASDLAPSWVIDYDHTNVMEATRELGAQLGSSPDAEQLVDFVFNYVQDKHYANGFLLASQVATTRAGDCTEHAVLTAALARSVGMPARVVFGAVILVSDAGIEAAGHAWAEVYVDGAWRIADATVPGLGDTAGIYYLPWGRMTREGPDYAISMVEMALHKPQRLVVAAADD